jgi:hypothetical protein
VCKDERGKEYRQRASLPNQNQRSQEGLQTSPDKREAFVQKKVRQLDKEALIEIKRHEGRLKSMWADEQR